MKSTINRILLPKSLAPRSYKISLVPNLTDFSCKGTVRIALTVTSPVDKIKLHASQIIFNRIRLLQDNKHRELDITSIKIDKAAETVEFPTKLDKDAELEIDFSSSINDKMRGFYRSNFTDAKKRCHSVACTQFEPTDARWAFPCWDEPAQKATFDLDITVPKKYVVLSNMPPKTESETTGGNKKVQFETSPVMSTYLLAWFIGEYHCKSLKTPNDVDVSVYTPPESLPKADWALSVAHKTLSFFEEYFSIKYPLPKLDMLAINDFANGAMENWGLITYRDTAIYSDENSSLRSKEWVTAVVAHELAHQWFGNLVTMEWWSQLWLNEGFATFMQVLANDRIYPEFRVWENFLEENLAPSLHLDSLASSHPVEVEIADASEINEVFDVISYQKGASVLRMLYEFLGDGDFRRGVSDYLNKHKFSNVDSDALWESLQTASGKNVGEIMLDFTRKQGYPQIKVRVVEQRETQRVYRLTQSRFLLQSEGEGRDGELWNVPIRVAVLGGASGSVRSEKWVQFAAGETTVEIDAKEGETVIFNHGFTGFFRVLYDPVPEGLRNAVEKGEIAMSDRFGLLMDSNAFFTARKTPAGDLLNLLESYGGEENENVWSMVIQTVAALKHVTKRSESREQFDRFVLRLSGKAIERLGLRSSAGEEDSKKKLRADLLSVRADAGDSATIEFLRGEFREHRGNPDGIDANLFSVVLNNAVKFGGKAEQQAVENMAETLGDPMRKNQALYAMGASREKSLLNYALEYCLSDKVRQQDAFRVFAAVKRNRFGTELAWDWFVEHYGELRERFKHDSLFSSFVSVVEQLDTREALSDAERFFEGKDRKGYEKALQQSLENAKVRLDLREEQLNNVVEWLSAKGY